MTSLSAVASTQAEGEYAQYRLNLLTLFGRSHSLAQIESWAHAAVQARLQQIDGFDNTLKSLATHYRRQRNSAGQLAGCAASVLQGWDRLDIASLRAQHGGLLVALFHYGAHRQVFADLANLAVSYVAPVAKRAYFDCATLAAAAPEAVGAAMDLIEVEDPRVGRRLIKGLREGRIGLIYVDGNMGPDGHGVHEGAVQVQFLGQRIRVKAGIARLACSLQLPVLPLLVGDSATGPCVLAGPLLQAPPKAGDSDALQQQLMQQLYDRLAHVVRANPVHWEYGYCLHRWIEPAIVSTPRGAQPDDDLRDLRHVQLVAAEVGLHQRDGQWFWVHLRQQRAYRLPQWCSDLHALLSAHSDGLAYPTVLQHLQSHGATGEQAVALVAHLLSRQLLQRPAPQSLAA